MQAVSSTYKRIFRQRGHLTDVRAEIDGTYYGIDSLYYVRQNLNLFAEDNPGIGSCCAGSLQLRLIPDGHIPRMAGIDLETRLVSPDGTESSEWIAAGTYFVDTRNREKNGTAITLTAFDSMLKADLPYLENSTLSTWPSPDTDVADEIADLMGIEVDSRTVLAGFDVPIPEQDWTMREVLGWIAAANGGNWIITPDDKLLLVKLSGITSLLGTDSSHALLLGDSLIVLSTGVPYEDTRELLGEDDTTAIKFGSDFIVMNGRGRDGTYSDTNNGLNLQRNAKALQNLGLLQPFTGVKLWKSHEVTYEEEMVTETVGTAIQTYPVQVEVEQSVMAGTDDGRVLEADCPWATQAMVDAILLQIDGYCWQGAVVEGAEITPAAELGDPVICDGVAFPLSNVNVTYDGGYAPTISAPADEEVDYEYHYESETERQLSRKVTLNENYYGFKVTRENGIEVENIVDGVSTTRMILNSNVQAFYNANGDEALYFDAKAGKYKFRGDVIITNGSLVLSSAFGLFSNDFTELEAAAITVPSGFNIYGKYNNSPYNFLRIYQSGINVVFESPADGYAYWDFPITYMRGDVYFSKKVSIGPSTYSAIIGKSTYPGNSLGYTGDDDTEIAVMGQIKALEQAIQLIWEYILG